MFTCITFLEFFIITGRIAVFKVDTQKKKKLVFNVFSLILLIQTLLYIALYMSRDEVSTVTTYELK